MKREERIEILKSRIDEFVKNGGDIQDRKENIPYYGYLARIIYLDKNEGKHSTLVSLYKECGYDYKDKANPLTIERVKKAIDEFVKNGGDIQDKKENIPYYGLVVEYIKKQKRENNIHLTIPEVLSLCGYEYNKKYYDELDCLRILNEYKDADGYVDVMKENENSNKLLKRVCERAIEAGADFNTYLMCFYGVRLKSSFSNVDYIGLVKEELKEFENIYGKEHVTIKDLKKYDPCLYSKVRHLGIYFPFGSITTSAVLNFFGYEVKAEDKVIEEKSAIDELNKIFPNREITHLVDLGTLYRKIVKLSACFDQSVDQYLTSRGFIVKTNSNMAYRLSKAVIKDSDQRYATVCKLRKELLNSSEILNSDKYSEKEKNEEFKRIGNLVMEKEEKLMLESKKKRN